MAFVFDPRDGAEKVFRDKAGQILCVLRGKRNLRRRKTGRRNSRDSKNVVAVLTQEEYLTGKR